MALRTHWVNRCFALGWVLLTASCGGTSKTERLDVAPEPEPVVDTGGNPPDCAVEAAYSVEWVESWETGSGAWYTNNDVCEPCNDLETDIDTLGRMASCFTAMQSVVDEFYSEVTSAPVGDAGVSSESTDIELTNDAGTVVTPWDQVVEAVVAAAVSCPEDPLIDPESDTLSDDIKARTAENTARQVQASADMAVCRPPCEASQTPSFFLDVTAASAVIGGARCGSRFALNVDTVPLMQWGLTIGKQYALTAAKDVTQFDGILFWARRGPNAPSDLKVSLADPNTEERALRDDGSIPCTYNAPYDDSSEGCDKFGKIVKLTEDWQLFVVPFKEMRQEGFGKIAPFLKLDSILGISFATRPGDHDLWIDDVGFYTRK